MLRTTFSLALLATACAIASAQAVKIEAHAGASDVWGRNYSSGKRITFSGRVTGIEVIRQRAGGDSEVTLLVRNSTGNGTAIVDVGPSWYVNHQVAKIRLKDNVQVTGSKVLADGKGIVLASMIRVNGQGGLVVTLRSPSGRAYWMGTETVQNTSVPTGPNVRNGTFTNFSTYSLNNVTYGNAMLQTDNGLLNIDLGPQWYYGEQNVAYQVGDRVSVVVGPNAISVGPNNNIYQTYSIYSGQNVYTVRDANGNPMYYWGGN